MSTFLDFWDKGAVGRKRSDPTSQTEDVTAAVGSFLRDPLGSLNSRSDPTIRDTPGIDTLVGHGMSDLPQGASPWDFVYVDGQLLPGIAKVSGQRRHRIDQPQGNGQTGLLNVHTGFDPGEIIIHLTMWTPQQWVRFKQVLQLFQPAPKNGDFAYQAVDVSHPGLEMLGIRRMYVVNVSVPQLAPSQKVEVLIQAIEFLPPKRDPPKVISSTVSAERAKNPGPDPTKRPSAKTTTTGPRAH